MTNFDPKVMMEAKAKVMITCFLWGMVFLLVWLLVYLFLGDWAYSIHSKMFRMTHHEFDLMNYCGMMGMKLILFVFYLIPWIAIKRTLKKI